MHISTQYSYKVKFCFVVHIKFSEQKIYRYIFICIPTYKCFPILSFSCNFIFMIHPPAFPLFYAIFFILRKYALTRQNHNGVDVIYGILPWTSLLGSVFDSHKVINLGKNYKIYFWGVCPSAISLLTAVAFCYQNERTQTTVWVQFEKLSAFIRMLKESFSIISSPSYAIR